ELIRSLSADKLVVISTHILEEVDAVCSRAIIIAAGRLLVDGSPEELVKQGGSLEKLFREVTQGGLQ
ncbi:MAG: ABC transporter ATP-binding protein, partial [Gammaproteobacteria bacterium]|nr:ABC transporter ATP-binding protein [Gammaproteobacteria bacterium]